MILSEAPVILIVLKLISNQNTLNFKFRRFFPYIHSKNVYTYAMPLGHNSFRHTESDEQREGYCDSW
jgi:hypothetical protein